MNAKASIITISLIAVFIGLLTYFYIHNRASSNTLGQNANNPQFAFDPQQKQAFKVGNNQPLDVLASTLPQFIMDLKDQKFKNLWVAQAAERNKMVESSLTNSRGETIQASTQFDDAQKQLMVTPQTDNKVKPGLYTLNIKVKAYTGEDITVTQDFTWGVLAINTDKAEYKVGDVAKLGMAVLDNLGQTKCIANSQIVYGTAKIKLTITSPSGQIQTLSTDDKSITGSNSCADRSVTNEPDFVAQLNVKEPGKYTIQMEAETIMGNNSLDYSFNVANTPQAFDITRSNFPTRIYPKADYPVNLNVYANQDYSGMVYDIVPKEFKISGLEVGSQVVDQGSFQTVEWQVDWKRGQSYTLGYTIHFPPVTPEFYLIGPFTIGHFKEGREWQIASDSLFNLVQEKDATGTTTNSVPVTFNSTATTNNLIVLICSTNSASITFTTPTGWTRRVRIRPSQGPSISYFDRLAPASFTTVNCADTSNININAQLLEFSGVSTSGFFDKVSATLSGSTTCNSGGHVATISSATPTNPDELAVSAFASNAGNLHVTGHNTISGASSNGYTDTHLVSGSGGFAQASVTSDSGWGEAVNNPPVGVNDAATFSAAATRCSGIDAFYNATLTISQGTYQFYTNIQNVTPAPSLAGTNTPITLSNPGGQFRLRILLDVDSPSGNTLGAGSADLILEYAALPTGSTCSSIASTDWNQVQNTTTDALGNPPTPIAFYDDTGVAVATNLPSTFLTDTGYTTLAENFYDDDNSDGQGGTIAQDISNAQNALANNQAGEWDLSLIDNSDDSTPTTYCLKIANSGGTDLAAYHNYPEITLAPVDVDIRGGSTIKGGTTIR